MRVAVIVDGVVWNVVEVRDVAKARELWPGALCRPLAKKTTEVDIGDPWDGSQFVRPAPPEE